MARSNSSSSVAGLAGTLFALVGILMFFGGLFFIPRVFVFIGVGIIALSLVAYYVEELGHRRHKADPASV